MQDAKALLDQFLGQACGAGAQAGQEDSGWLNDIKNIQAGPGALAGTAIAGGLVGLLLGSKKPRKLAASALKLGGVALIGGLAYKAYRDWQENKAPTPPARPVESPPPAGTEFLPASDGAQQDLSRTLVRAMIAAAKADGHVSPEELGRISRQLSALGIEAENRVFIEHELAAPLDIGAVASSATSREHAAEIYAASLLTVDANGAAERGYLAMLAARLNLPDDLVAHLHANADSLVQSETA